jgi:hypothetical protein
MKLIISLILFSFFFSPITRSEEELFIISDIDDTIKITHVGKLEMVIKGLQSNHPFIGFSELYRRWRCHNLKSHRKVCIEKRASVKTPGRKMVYVSGAPKPIHGLAKKFLRLNQFPDVPFFGRPSLRIHTLDFKIDIIGKIIKKAPGAQFILIGDNGEKDPKVYDAITKKFSKRIKKSYLHAIYNAKGPKTPLFKGQVPYLTSVDLGIHFLNEGWISEKDLKAVIKNVLKTSIKKPQDLIPKWFHCKTFFKDGHWPKLLSKKGQTQKELPKLISKAKTMIEQLKTCH